MRDKVKEWGKEANAKQKEGGTTCLKWQKFFNCMGYGAAVLILPKKVYWCMPEAVSLKWAVRSCLPSAETGTSLRTVALRPCFFYAFVQNHIVLIVGPLITTVTIVTGQINCVLWALIIACAMVVPDWCWIESIKTSWYKRCRFWQEGREGKKLHSASGLCGGFH